MSEAKECPLCGKPAYTWVHPYDELYVWAACQTPGCAMNQRNFRLDWWNTRPIEDALRAERDAALEQVRQLIAENAQLREAITTHTRGALDALALAIQNDDAMEIHAAQHVLDDLADIAK